MAIRFTVKGGVDGAVRIETRFISADLGLLLDLEIAAGGGLSAGPVSPDLLQPETEIR
jgi:hypothetical protein